MGGFYVVDTEYFFHQIIDVKGKNAPKGVIAINSLTSKTDYWKLCSLYIDLHKTSFSAALLKHFSIDIPPSKVMHAKTQVEPTSERVILTISIWQLPKDKELN